MPVYLRPLPLPDPDSAAFWQGCRDHKLLVQRCAACGQFRYPPRPHCPYCRARRVEWVQARGTGSVFSWIVVTHPVPREVFAGEVPYVVALIELDEGVRLASNLVGCATSDVSAGMRVKVCFDDVTPDTTLPKFRPE